MIHFSVSINLDDVSAFSIYFSLNMSIQDTTQKNMIYRYTLADETVEMRFGDFSEFCEILELSEFCTRGWRLQENAIKMHKASFDLYF